MADFHQLCGVAGGIHCIYRGGAWPLGGRQGTLQLTKILDWWAMEIMNNFIK